MWKTDIVAFCPEVHKFILANPYYIYAETDDVSTSAQPASSRSRQRAKPASIFSVRQQKEPGNHQIISMATIKDLDTGVIDDMIFFDEGRIFLSLLSTPTT